MDIFYLVLTPAPARFMPNGPAFCPASSNTHCC